MIVLVTGCNGLVGEAVSRLYLEQGHRVVGVDNDMRSRFFGPEASTVGVGESLKQYPQFELHEMDIRSAGIAILVHKNQPDLIVHCAAQPSHDWAASDPFLDHAVNCTGTLMLLEAVRHQSPKSKFVFLSTNKVYGDMRGVLSLFEDRGTRYHPVQKTFGSGIRETMPVDHTKHSLFGCSKLAADVYVQEYGRYFGLQTVVLRGGCLTGATHKGAKMHGFLSYLFKCAATGEPYTVIGYKGKQVRDNIAADDVAAIVQLVAQSTDLPPGIVFNVGGEWDNSCSVLEAISAAEARFGRPMKVTFEDVPRSGDHQWYVTNMDKFRTYFPTWKKNVSLSAIYDSIYLSYAGDQR